MPYRYRYRKSRIPGYRCTGIYYCNPGSMPPDVVRWSTGNRDKRGKRPSVRHARTRSLSPMHVHVTQRTSRPSCTMLVVPVHVHARVRTHIAIPVRYCNTRRMYVCTGTYSVLEYVINRTLVPVHFQRVLNHGKELHVYTCTSTDTSSARPAAVPVPERKIFHGRMLLVLDSSTGVRPRCPGPEYTCTRVRTGMAIQQYLLLAHKNHARISC